MNLYEVVNKYKSETYILSLGGDASMSFDYYSVVDYYDDIIIGGFRITKILEFEFVRESEAWIVFKIKNKKYWSLSIKKSDLF